MVGVVASVVVLTPWVAFNLSRFDHTVLLSENIGGTVATSNCDAVYYGRLLGYWSYQCGQDILTAHHIGPYAFNGAADRDQFNGGLKYIEAHKGRVPVVVAARVGRITDLFHARQQAHLDVYLENTTSWVSFAGLYTFYPMALLAVAGAVVMRRRRTARVPAAGAGALGARHRRAVLRGHPVPGHRRGGAVPAGRRRARRRARRAGPGPRTRSRCGIGRVQDGAPGSAMAGTDR